MNGGLIIPNKDTARALNDLARHKAIVRILNDIRMDMEICEIEGWDKNEYLNLIRELFNSIGGKIMSDLISRRAAIELADELKDDLPDDERIADAVMARNEGILEYQTKLSLLPSAHLDRDIPKKPNETTDRSWGIPHRQAVCPNCDSYLGTIHFISKDAKLKVTFCESCGQAIDWEGWESND